MGANDQIADHIAPPGQAARAGQIAGALNGVGIGCDLPVLEGLRHRAFSFIKNMEDMGKGLPPFTVLWQQKEAAPIGDISHGKTKSFLCEEAMENQAVRLVPSILFSSAT